MNLTLNQKQGVIDMKYSNKEDLNDLDKAIENIYFEQEPPADLKENLINNVYASIIESNCSLNHNKNNTRKYHLYNNSPIKMGITAVALLFILIALKSNYITNHLKGLPAYIVEQRTFSSINKAQKYIKDFPFTPPKSIPKEFSISKIVYTKNKDSSAEVDFVYTDKNYNELNIRYTDYSYKPSSLNEEYLQVETSTVYSQPKGVTITKENHLSPLTEKELRMITGKYFLTAEIHYNSKIPDSDTTGDNELVKIMEGYLNSELYRNLDNSNLISGKDYTTYSSFDDLMKALPQSVNITKPGYTPESFELENIKYKMINPKINYFIINATYKNPYNTRIIFNYTPPGKNGMRYYSVITHNIFIIKTNENNNFQLVPITEKEKCFSNDHFDLNVYFQYDENDTIPHSTKNSELDKIIESIKNS